MENHMCHDLSCKVGQLPDNLKGSLQIHLYGRDELQSAKRLTELLKRHDEKQKQAIENSEEAMEYREAQMAA